jgi:hypothetical protein
MLGAVQSAEAGIKNAVQSAEDGLVNEVSVVKASLRRRPKVRPTPAEVFKPGVEHTDLDELFTAMKTRPSTILLITLFPAFFFTVIYLIMVYTFDASPGEGAKEEMWKLVAKEETWAANGITKWKMTATSPTSHMDHQEFKRYYTLISWITVCITGFGSEAILGLHLLKSVSLENMKVLWHFAQFLFPLLALCSIQLAATQNGLCFIVLVGGLWKFGFPETASYLNQVMEWNRQTTLVDTLLTLGSLCAGVGMLLHHSSSCLLISCLHSGIVPITESILSCLLPLLMQHWFVIMKYHNKGVYTVIELLLEAFFEWEVFSNLQNLYGADWMVGLSACVMIFAHWLYLLSAVFDMIHAKVAPASSSDEVDKNASQDTV